MSEKTTVGSLNNSPFSHNSCSHTFSGSLTLCQTPTIRESQPTRRPERKSECSDAGNLPVSVSRTQNKTQVLEDTCPPLPP